MKPVTLVFTWLLVGGLVSGRPSIMTTADIDAAPSPTNDYSQILAMRENLLLALHGLDDSKAKAEQFVYPATTTTTETSETSTAMSELGQMTVGLHEMVTKTVDSIAGNVSGNPWLAYGLIGLGLALIIAIVSLVICFCCK